MRNRSRTIIYICLLMALSAITAYAQEDSFEGIWIRKPYGSEEFDPFAPDFAVIGRIGNNYLVLSIDSILVGDTRLASCISQFFHAEGETLVWSSTKFPITSVFSLTPDGELYELVNNRGENIYIRPTISDFAAQIEFDKVKLAEEPPPLKNELQVPEEPEEIKVEELQVEPVEESTIKKETKGIWLKLSIIEGGVILILAFLLVLLKKKRRKG